MSEAAVITRGANRSTEVITRGTVLIVDDEAEIRESLQTLLEMEDTKSRPPRPARKG